MFAADRLRRAGITPPGDGHALVVLAASSDFAGEFEAARAALSDTEGERAARFRFARDAETFIAAHALWRSVLALVLDTRAPPLTFSPSGQPLLAGTPYATSLSHSGRYIAIAVARSGWLGVDIEQDPPRINLDALATSIATLREQACVMALPARARQGALLALWTRKEALLKSLGTGLLLDPATVDADAGTMIAVDGYPPMRIHPLDLRAGLKGALAAPADVSTVTTTWLPARHRTRVTPDGLSRSYVQPMARPNPSA